ncbi:MAG TPA: alginate lyase, partial [Gammaproteobacteria bacterium]|nr:alginate lyase [Gammaproteobacteria bacterium]
MLQRPLHTVALAALLAAFANAAFAAPQVLSACQPATSNPTSKSLLAAAQRHLGDQPDALPH